MRRRQVIALFGGAAAAWPLGALAQTAKRWRIGVVLPGTPASEKPLAEAMEQRLLELGYQNGRNINLVIKFVPPQPELVEAAIAALVPDIDVLAVLGTIGGVAAKKAAPDVPTVFAGVGAPIDIGLAQSLAHPGGNMTGITFEAAIEAYGKRLQVLKELAPRAARVAVLRAAGDANAKISTAVLERSAARLGIMLSAFDLRSPDDLDGAFAAIVRSRGEAVMVVAGALTYANSARIADLALSARLPSCYGFREAVAAGGLVSIGPDLVDLVRQMPAYLDKIMRGAKPGDLPIQEPNRFELWLNIKTAKLLGLDIPPALLATADGVVE